MGFVGDMFSSGKGSGFTAAGPSEGQMQTAFDQTQTGIKQQQDFVNALATHGGLSNQAHVFNMQQHLADQLGNLSVGVGPNPAQAQLAQNTAANTANQAALMAGQRGSGQNAGMIARQAAMQGSANQQNSVGQSATLQAQQQLAAMQQLQNQQSSMGNMANTQVNQRQAALSGYNQSALQQQANLMGGQSSANSANAAIAGGNQRGQQNMIGGLMGGMGSAMNLVGKLGSSGAGGLASSGVADMAGGAGDAIGGIGEGAIMMAAQGGEVESANPLESDIKPQQVDAPSMPQGPQSSVGKMFNETPVAPIAASSGGGGGMGPNMAAGASSMGGEAGGIGNAIGMNTSGIYRIANGQGSGFGDSITSHLGSGDLGKGLGKIGEVYAGMAGMPNWVGGLKFSDGGKVPALLSPGERYLAPNQVEEVKKGANPMAEGKKVPGKPRVDGAKNSYKNDTVKADLEEGGIVIPRSVTMSKDAPERAAAFVRAVLAKKGHLPSPGKSLPKKSK